MATDKNFGQFTIITNPSTTDCIVGLNNYANYEQRVTVDTIGSFVSQYFVAANSTKATALSGNQTLPIYMGGNDIQNCSNNIKAWVNFNGTGGASINASYNVSSVQRTTTGQYTINFTNPLNYSSYCYAGMGCSGVDNNYYLNINGARKATATGQTTQATKTTTLVKILYQGSNTIPNIDSSNISFIIIGF